MGDAHAMMDFLLELDRQILLAINGWNCPAADAIMVTVSKIAVWVPLYVAVAAAFFFPKWYGAKSYAGGFINSGSLKPWMVALASIIVIALATVFTDQISNLIKNSVCRLRPTHDPLLADAVRALSGKGGLYGFTSGHAANTAGFALLTSLIIRRIPYTVGISIWCAVICYSRMYLARHFLGDILGGIAIGIIIGVLMYLLWKAVLRKFAEKRAAE